MSSNEEEIQAIIHTAAASSAVAAAGLSQAPGSDNAVITPIQVTMIMAIGTVYGKKIGRAAALSMLSTLSAGVAGRALSQFLVGWVPGFGNAVNATTAFAITESIGWAANEALSGE